MSHPANDILLEGFHEQKEELENQIAIFVIGYLRQMNWHLARDEASLAMRAICNLFSFTEEPGVILRALLFLEKTDEGELSPPDCILIQLNEGIKELKIAIQKWHILIHSSDEKAKETIRSVWQHTTFGSIILTNSFDTATMMADLLLEDITDFEWRFKTHIDSYRKHLIDQL